MPTTPTKSCGFIVGAGSSVNNSMRASSKPVVGVFSSSSGLYGKRYLTTRLAAGSSSLVGANSAALSMKMKATTTSKAIGCFSPSLPSSSSSFSSFHSSTSSSRTVLSSSSLNNTNQTNDQTTNNQTPNSDLLELRGVGPVNAALLLARQIDSVDHLQQIYRGAFKGDKVELQRFLSEVVGFRNPAHCRSVADHLEDLHWEPRAAPIKLAVEGNIGAGKSTFLDILQDSRLELQDLIEIVPEPVDEWRQVNNGAGEPINLLDRFYKDPKRYAYTFQHYVLLTRMEKDRKARSSSKPLRVLERSIFSDRLVFVRAMYEAGFMGDLELQLYDSWFAMEIAQDRQLTPDGFIYLKARPETCIKRLRARNRSEEAGVDHDYLANLHDKHESWLHFRARSAEGQLMETRTALQSAAAARENGMLSFEEPHSQLIEHAPSSIRDNIVFIGRDGRPLSPHSGEKKVFDALSGIPALVLDHEQEDILHDLDARQDYAKKVKDFSDYVASISNPLSRFGLEVADSEQKGLTLTAEHTRTLKELISDYEQHHNSDTLNPQLRSLKKYVSSFSNNSDSLKREVV